MGRYLARGSLPLFKVNQMNKLMMVMVLVLVAGCAGTKARTEALNPVAIATWNNVRMDYERGVAAGLDAGEIEEVRASTLRGFGDLLSASLASGDRDSLSEVPWTVEMVPWAKRGVHEAVVAGELGPNGATLLYQRIQNLTDVLLTLQGKLSVVSWRTSREVPNQYVRAEPILVEVAQ